MSVPLMDKMSLDRKFLTGALSRVLGAVDKKLVNPILQHCLVQKTESAILITTNDLEMQIQVRKLLSTKDLTSQAGKISFTIPAKVSYDFCKAIQHADTVELSKKDLRIQMVAGASRLEVSSGDVSDFPRFLEGKSGSKTVFSIPRKKLKEALEAVQYAMAISDVRYYLNGVFLQIVNSELTCVATDGHRLAMVKLPISLNAYSEDTMNGVILPRRAVIELIRLLDYEDYPLVFSFSKDIATIGFDELEFSFKLIEGKFPDYRRVLPKNLSYKVQLSRDRLKEALALVSPILSSKERGVLFHFSDKGLELRAISSEHYEATTFIDMHTESESVTIAFNFNYISDYIAHSKAKELTLEYQDASLGVIFSSEVGSSYVVMPLIL